MAALAAVTCALIAVVPAARSDDDARAHAIAERFAGASDEARKAEEAKKRAEIERLRAVKAAAEAKRKAEDAKRRADTARLKAEQMKADEAEMLARARAEAAEREAEQKRAQAELELAEQEKAAREHKLAEDARIAAETAAAAEQVRTEALRIAAEKAERERADQLAKTEADASAAREAKAAADKLAAEKAASAEAEKRAAEAREAEFAREAELKARADRAARLDAERRAEAERQELEVEREQEAMRLTEKIRKAREAREARQTAGSEPVTSTPETPPGGVVHAARSTTAPTAGRRVAVLLMMTAGNKGIRRWNKSADPMLCVAEVCYVSTGPGLAAKRLPRSTAFGPGVALGSRAGACNNSLGCVFRDVDLEAASALVQPIDLRIVRHDRREASEARADDTCAVAGGKLECRSGVTSSTWRAWIVPEDIAARAGAASLEAALASGLPVSEARVRGDR